MTRPEQARQEAENHQVQQPPATKKRPLGEESESTGAVCPFGAKQDPVEKRRRGAAADGKVYFSYAQIHAAVCGLAPEIRAWKPDVMVAIGGGGFIPARMLRTEVKVPILAVSLELYDDATKTANNQVLKKQWFDEMSGAGQLVRGKRVLVVDEVDDSRATLEYCVRELKETNAPGAIAVAVVHNKLKPKKGRLPADVAYFAGEEVEDRWNCYPWDAGAYEHTILEHEELARSCLDPQDLVQTGDMGLESYQKYGGGYGAFP